MVKRSVATCMCVFAICFSPLPASSADGVRTIALVDFAVRAPDSPEPASSWLGPAVSELVQAKMQLFGGARVLERLRVQSLLREGKVDAGAAAEEPAALAAFIPAEMLIAGSVNVDPKDQRRIRVQARAFEVQTSKIVAEATFTGTGDLAGLLQIAEDLARTLADGLKLAYTQEQLAYTEPAGIDTLRLFVDGEGHLAAGRHRDAITAFQKALEGNGGRYYAAAHRLQGEAYQALAKVSVGEQERAVRDEYLKKFKEDALAASGALFDLGLAFEANRMWADAARTYADYLSAVGREADVVRWVFDPRAALGAKLRDLNRLEKLALFSEEGRVHLFPDRSPYSWNTAFTWLVLELASGVLQRSTPFPEELRRFPEACESTQHTGRVLGVWEDRAIAVGEGGLYSGRGHEVCPFVAAVTPNGQVRWRVDLGGKETDLLEATLRDGLVFAHLGNQEWSRELPHQLVTIDAATGATLSRISIKGSLAFLDPVSARWTSAEGSHDLVTGGRLETPPGAAPGAAPAAGRAPAPQRPTGVRGVSYRQDPTALRFFKNGRETLSLPGGDEMVDAFGPSGETILLRRTGNRSGFTLVDTVSWKTTVIYEKTQARFLARNVQHLVFALPSDPGGGGLDPAYGLPGTERSLIVNVVEGSTGRVVSKFRLRDAVESPQALFAGDDLILSRTDRVARVSIVPRQDLVVRSAAETHLRIASCRGALGDPVAARSHVEQFERVFLADPRGEAVRLTIAQLEGRQEEAGRLALRVLGSGGAGTEEAGTSLAVLRKVRPEVRDVVRTPARGRLHLRAVTGEGAVVATPEGVAGSGLHFVIDSRSNQSALVRTPGFKAESVNAYANGKVYGIGSNGELLAYDLASGAKTAAQVGGARLERLVPGLPGAVVLARGTGEPTRALAFFDPETLAVLFEAPVDGSPQLICRGEGTAVFAETGWAGERRDSSVLVLDTARPAELLRLAVPLEKERIAAAALADGQLVLAIAGGDFDRLDNWGLAAWLRIESYPVGAGERWSFRQEGVLAGTVLLEQGRVSFPAFPGKFPEATVREKQDFPPFRVRRDDMPLALLTLDRSRGALISVEPYGPDPWALMPHRTASDAARRPASGAELERASRYFVPDLPGPIFLQKAYARSALFSITRRYWFFSSDSPPAEIEPGPAAEWRSAYPPLVAELPVIVWRDLVFEAIGGGAVLVKDLAGGAGVPGVAGERVR